MKRKTVTKLFGVLMVLILALSISACKKDDKTPEEPTTPVNTETPDTPETPETGEAEIAIILKTLSNPFWVSMKEGIEAEAEKLGIKVDVYAAQSEDDLQGQLNLFETAISKKYKAIGVAPLSPVNLNTAIVKANNDGIYVGNIDEKVDVDQLKSLGGSIVFFITTDNVAVGAKGAGYIIEQLPEGGKVAIIEGKSGNASGEDRKNGATEAFEANPKFQVVDSQPADWDRTKALDVAANIISKNPDLVAIYACNDTMALGAWQAVVNAGKEDKIIVVGTDGAPEAIDSIKANGLAATVAQDPAEIGAASLRMLNETIKNKPAIDPNVIPDMTPIDSELITK